VIVLKAGKNETNMPNPENKKTTEKKPAPKSPAESSVEMAQLVLPSDANALGTIFGGKIMAWIDIAAAIAAGRHARRAVVTASLDALHFVAPVKVGHVVLLHASVNYAARTSMEIGVRVDSENPLTGERTHTATAYTTFVALDDHGRPTPVPPLVPSSPEEKRRYEEARKRRESRVRLAEELQSSRG
jgi:acyl-CoA hydrolase